MLKITTVVMYILYSKWCYGATVKYMEAYYILKKKTENQHTVYIFLKNTHAYQKKKKMGWGINHLSVNNNYFWEVESLVISSFFLLLVQGIL